MAITEPEWDSIRSMIEAVSRREVGTRRDYFTTGKVIKVDPKRNCVFLEEFGDQPIPIVAFNRSVKTYDTVPVWTPEIHVIGAAGEPAFQNNWVNYDAVNFQAASFYKDGFGIVHLQGLIKLGTMSGAAFTLPVGFRPTNYTHFATISAGAFGGFRVVATTGDVIPVEGANNWFNLDGATFNSGVPPATSSATQVKSARQEISLPSVGQSVLVARELGTRRLPRALGVILGKDWIVAEED